MIYFFLRLSDLVQTPTHCCSSPPTKVLSTVHASDRRMGGMSKKPTAQTMARIRGPASGEVLSAFRKNRPASYCTMQELCSCAIAECRMFQALVHTGVVQSVDDYEEYYSPVFVCNADDDDDLYEALVHDAVENEANVESVACDLGIDCMEDGMTVTMRTSSGDLLQLKAVVGEYDTTDDAMLAACKASKDIRFRSGDDPASGEFTFYSCRCTLTRVEQSDSAESEEEAQSTEEEEDDDDDNSEDDDYVMSDDDDRRPRNRAPGNKRKKRKMQR